MTVQPDQAVRVRKAAPGDESLLYRWRTLAWVVSLGASKSTPTPEQHAHWFAETLAQRTRLLFIIEVDGAPAGMVRFDAIDPHAAEVSLYLMPEYCGRGVGSRALARAIVAARPWRRLDVLRARVLPGNNRSIRFFEALGFRSANINDGAPIVLTRAVAHVQHSRPWISPAEIDVAAEAIAARQLAQGPRARALEVAWCRRTGATDAVAVGSGIGALRLSLLALGIGVGDEVIVPAYSCVALLNAPLSIGAVPVPADVSPDTWTLNPDDVARRITRRTRAIVAVHLFGMPAPMRALRAFRLPIVEDCAHGIGGVSDGVPFGVAGDVSITSFYATKMIAGGEGGMVASMNQSLTDSVRRARDYGDQLPDGRLLNDKITEVAAAVAGEQISRLDDLLERREHAARRYDQWLEPLASANRIVLPPRCSGRIWYRYIARLTRAAAGALVDAMRARGVYAEQPVWDYRAWPAYPRGLSATSAAFDSVVSLPLYPDLDRLEQQLVCDALADSLDELAA